MPNSRFRNGYVRHEAGTLKEPDAGAKVPGGGAKPVEWPICGVNRPERGDAREFSRPKVVAFAQGPVRRKADAPGLNHNTFAGVDGPEGRER